MITSANLRLKFRIATLYICTLGVFGMGFTPSAAAATPIPSLPGNVPFKIQVDHVPGEVLVKFRNSPSIVNIAKDTAAIHSALDARAIGTLPLMQIQRVRGLRGQSAEALLLAYASRADVEYVEPNVIFHTQVRPNDRRFGELWGLNNTRQTGGMFDADIDGPEAWDVQRGSSSVVVANIDTGVDYNHPDLAANMWTNPGETPGNGIDDDANGYVDDVRGWDFANNDNDPMDDNGHGTHTAGTIGAVGNNAIGVTGVAWNVKIMPLKFISATAGGNLFHAAQAILYAANMGAVISNNSWGAGFYSQTIEDAIIIANQRGMLFVAAAGNANANNDTVISYPCNSTVANVLCVAATDHNDQKATFSSFGAVNVDLGAPGVLILSTVPTGTCGLCNVSGYRALNGTSMASPHVAGAAALVKSQFPTMSAVGIKNLLMQTVDPVASLAGLTVSGGRINISNAVGSAGTPPPLGGTTTITVAASGTPVAGVYPEMVLRVDGQVVGTFNVSNTVSNYSVQVKVTAGVSHRIDVVYTNDVSTHRQNRNLTIQTLQVKTTTIRPTDAGVVYDRGTGNAAFDGRNVGPGLNTMPVNGALRFTVPAAAF